MIILMLSALALLWLRLCLFEVGDEEPARGWDEGFLLAVVFWAAAAIVLAEVLGAVGLLRQTPLAIGWGTIDLALTAVLVVAARHRRIRRPAFRLSRSEAIVVALLGGILLALAAVAFAAPPNNVDSLQYHMARVARWEQQASLRHFATGYGPQLWNPPAAEILILQLRLLLGDDRAANFVQWLSYVSGLVAASWGARRFDLRRPARWVAVGFAASIPMAVLQSTSTQNDLVVALWLAIFAGLVLNGQGRPLRILDALGLGLSLGLGMLTKGTFYLFAAPFLIWFVASRPWLKAPGRSASQLLVVGLLAAALNVPHAWRNFQIGWSPIGPPSHLSPRWLVTSGESHLRAGALHAVQAGLLQFTTPSPAVNTQVVAWLNEARGALGVTSGEPQLRWDWNYEDLAGSPLHFLAILVAGAVVIVRRGWPSSLRIHVACLAFGFVLSPLLSPLAVVPTAIRYQLPVLVAGSPVVAAVLSRRLSSSALSAAAIALLVAALPWVLFNKSRPVIAMRPNPGPWEIPCVAGCTSIGSVFTAPRVDLLFANRREHQQEYMETAEVLRQGECRNVGLRLESYDPEYAWWYLVAAPQSGFRLETIYTSADLEPLIDRSFRPCAIVCTICGGRTRLHGLELGFESGSVRLFLGDGFTWDEDG